MLQHMSTIRSLFSSQLRQFFTWIALGDLDLYFLLILVTDTNAIEGRTASAR